MYLTDGMKWAIIGIVATFLFILCISLLPHPHEVSDMDQAKTMCNGNVVSFHYEYNMNDDRENPVVTCGK